jgi:hypothetical protein
MGYLFAVDEDMDVLFAELALVEISVFELSLGKLERLPEEGDLVHIISHVEC